VQDPGKERKKEKTFGAIRSSENCGEKFPGDRIAAIPWSCEAGFMQLAESSRVPGLRVSAIASAITTTNQSESVTRTRRL
jgi:hypothetical protein